MALKVAGCDLKHIVLSRRNLEALQVVKDHFLKAGSKCKVHVLPCDLTDIEASKKFSKDALAACEDQVDVLILSGGLSSRSSFLETDVEVDEMLMKVNYLSGAAITKGIVPSMVKNKSGLICWISSVQGLIGTPFRTSYAASKFAVQGYCEALRSELTSSGVGVHCVSPGYINTNLSLNAATGNVGSKHGKLDETTANGADPIHVAVEILDSVVTKRRSSDFIVAATPSARAAIALKLIAPKFLEKKLVKRFLKSEEDE
jgi:dehydrogenase/reductase SDR family protein 7B